jgi:hypothetical protein
VSRPSKNRVHLTVDLIAVIEVFGLSVTGGEMSCSMIDDGLEFLEHGVYSSNIILSLDVR